MFHQIMCHDTQGDSDNMNPEPREQFIVRARGLPWSATAGPSPLPSTRGPWCFPHWQDRVGQVTLQERSRT